MQESNNVNHDVKMHAMSMHTLASVNETKELWNDQRYRYYTQNGNMVHITDAELMM